MRTAIGMAVCLVAGLSSVWSCKARTQSGLERQVVVYTSVDQTHAEPILRAYEAETGVRVLAVYDVEASKAVGLASRLIAEEHKPKADVFWNGEVSQTVRLKNRGLLEPYHSPSAKSFPGPLKDQDGCWTGMGPRYRVWVSTKSFRPVELSFQDLAKVDLPGNRIAISLPLFGTGSFQAAAMVATLGEEKAVGLYEGYRKKGIRFAPGNSSVRDWVVADQVTLGLVDSDDACAAIQRGAEINVFLPKETLIIPQTVALIRGSPNPAEARKLIDYLLGPEVEAQLIASGFAQVALHPNSPEPLLKLPKPNPMAVSLEEIARVTERASQRMREVFAP